MGQNCTFFKSCLLPSYESKGQRKDDLRNNCFKCIRPRVLLSLTSLLLPCLYFYKHTVVYERFTWGSVIRWEEEGIHMNRKYIKYMFSSCWTALYS